MWEAVRFLRQERGKLKELKMQNHTLVPNVEDLPEHYSELVETNYKRSTLSLTHGYLKMCYP